MTEEKSQKIGGWFISAGIGLMVGAISYLLQASHTLTNIEARLLNIEKTVELHANPNANNHPPLHYKEFTNSKIQRNADDIQRNSDDMIRHERLLHHNQSTR